MSPAVRVWQIGGGLGSGKSSVRRLLEESGVTGIDADAVGHEVLSPTGPAFPAVAERWPGSVREGRIDRGALAEFVFSDPEQLAELESLTHPHIFGTIRDRLDEVSGMAVVEVPLLNRPALQDWGKIVVDCVDEVRLRRSIDRGMSREDALARMEAQPSRAEWLASGDVVVPNHGDMSDLRETLRRLVPLL